MANIFISVKYKWLLKEKMLCDVWHLKINVWPQKKMEYTVKVLYVKYYNIIWR